MTKKILARRVSIDPSVVGLLEGMEQRQIESQLPHREREKKSRERAKISARRERRATYDLPPLVRIRMTELSGQLSLPASQLVTLALTRFITDYDSGKIDLSIYKQPSLSPRYDWNLVIPGTNDFESNQKKKKRLPIKSSKSR
jgi:hypothetical protein